ncbi:unnamed protein product [Boreogadus saida]
MEALFGAAWGDEDEVGYPGSTAVDRRCQHSEWGVGGQLHLRPIPAQQKLSVRWHQATTSQSFLCLPREHTATPQSPLAHRHMRRAV